MLAAILGLGAFVAWLVAVVSFVRALSHRAEGVSLGALLFQGMKVFDARSFTPEGQRHQKRFLIGFTVFFAIVVAAAVLGVVLGS